MSVDHVYCRDCGSEIRARAEVCPECGIRQRPPPASSYLRTVVSGRSRLVAATLSAMFPGLGHLYAREFGRALGFAVAFVLALPTVVVLVGVVLVPVVWLYGVYDAARTAGRRDRRPAPEVPALPES